MNVVISQSMYFPWVGFLEQIRLANAFVQYDDVQFSRGSFTNRVQFKTSAGPRWLTVPLRGVQLGHRIDEVLLDNRSDWRGQHLAQLSEAYRNSPFFTDMLALVDSVFSQPATTLSELSHSSTMALAKYFDLTAHQHQYKSTEFGITGGGSQRVLDIVSRLGGNTYITGHGARNYLNHRTFEQVGIEVRYMNYLRLPYPQQHGQFTPYVSALDLVANCGQVGISYIRSTTINWKEFHHEST
jgi:hypothetical protein